MILMAAVAGVCFLLGAGLGVYGGICYCLRKIQ